MRKNALIAVGVLLFVQPLPLSPAVSPAVPDDEEECKFEVREDSTKPIIKAAYDILPRVKVIDQPDSPLKILMVDLGETTVSEGETEFSFRSKCKFRVRNQSNRHITGLNLMVSFSTGGGVGTGREGSWSGLAPGQEREISGCSGGGVGRLHGSKVSMAVHVEGVDFGTCAYYPSCRVPNGFRVAGRSLVRP